MSDYKNTLNLPHTDFPMKANLAQREPEFSHHWEQIQLYQKLREKNKNNKKFILHDGPPYANGHIHIGHAVNKVLKDIVVKAKTFSGFDAPFVPGWDCHGLPIELNVEKKFGAAGDKLTAKEFREQCRLYAEEQISIQREEFKRLGVVGDWNNPYRTMDFSYEANIIRALAKIIANGHLQQGFKPVHWCVNCGSALAEAEVEYANKISPAIDVKFKVVDAKALEARLPVNNRNHLGEGSVSIPIWTTTPWTLPANEAVALNAEIDYSLIQINSTHGTERLIIASDLVEACLARYQITEHQQIIKVKGNVLENLLLQHPFYNRQVPVVLGDHVTLETGTGAVHTAPAHGQEDYMVGLHYKLPLINPVGSNGCYLPTVEFFAGEHVLKANSKVIELLKENNALLSEQKLDHSYPHCWRHKTPLIFLATPQWFISMEQNKLRTEAIAAIHQVQWVPEWGQARIEGMIAGRPDWCISRQRAWGVPLSLIVHKQTRALHPEQINLMEKIAQRVEQKGIEAWHELNLNELIDDTEHYEKINDTLDVWFDSGVSHFCVLAKNKVLQWPADLYLEGSDQHRGWFHSSLLTAIGMHSVAPYKAVLTHGFTVDEKGRKMSKSLGNVIAPEKVINSLGADILRLWISSTDYRGEIAVSDEILKRTGEAYRRIRNTLRFLLANLHDFDPVQHLVTTENMLALDRWIVKRAHSLQNEITQAYDDYQFHVIYHKLHNFCINELGSFYLDIIKDRQYTTKKDIVPRRSAQTALYHIAEAMVRWCAPILSFTAEELWRYLPGKRSESVFLNTWYQFPVTECNELFSDDDWQKIINVRSAVNKEIENKRSAGLMGAALEAEVTLYCDHSLKILLDKLGNELRFILITSLANVLTLDERSTDAISSQFENLWINVTPSSHAKCARCWHRRADVGSNAEHPEICGRCVENVAGQGETRLYA